MGYNDRIFSIPSNFVALSGALQGFKVNTATKIAEESGDTDVQKLAARNELLRLVDAIKRVGLPIIAKVGKDSTGDKPYFIEFSFEQASLVASASAFEAILNVPTVATPSTKFQVTVTLLDVAVN